MYSILLHTITRIKFYLQLGSPSKLTRICHGQYNIKNIKHIIPENIIFRIIINLCTGYIFRGSLVRVPTAKLEIIPGLLNDYWTVSCKQQCPGLDALIGWNWMNYDRWHTTSAVGTAMV